MQFFDKNFGPMQKHGHEDDVVDHWETLENTVENVGQHFSVLTENYRINSDQNDIYILQVQNSVGFRNNFLGLVE